MDKHIDKQDLSSQGMKIILALKIIFAAMTISNRETLRIYMYDFFPSYIAEHEKLTRQYKPRTVQIVRP